MLYLGLRKYQYIFYQKIIKKNSGTKIFIFKHKGLNYNSIENLKTRGKVEWIYSFF
jgi:hypothetical protein